MKYLIPRVGFSTRKKMTPKKQVWSFTRRQTVRLHATHTNVLSRFESQDHPRMCCIIPNIKHALYKNGKKRRWRDRWTFKNKFEFNTCVSQSRPFPCFPFSFFPFSVFLFHFYSSPCHLFLFPSLTSLALLPPLN